MLESDGREHLRNLERKLGTTLKFIHVVRNPFDNIATLALRRAKVKKNKVQDNLEVGTQTLDSMPLCYIVTYREEGGAISSVE